MICGERGVIGVTNACWQRCCTSITSMSSCASYARQGSTLKTGNTGHGRLSGSLEVSTGQTRPTSIGFVVDGERL